MVVLLAGRSGSSEPSGQPCLFDHNGGSGSVATKDPRPGATCDSPVVPETVRQQDRHILAFQPREQGRFVESSSDVRGNVESREIAVQGREQSSVVDEQRHGDTGEWTVQRIAVAWRR
jgi:hypothetical protein